MPPAIYPLLPTSPIKLSIQAISKLNLIDISHLAIPSDEINYFDKCACIPQIISTQLLLWYTYFCRPVDCISCQQIYDISLPTIRSTNMPTPFSPIITTLEAYMNGQTGENMCFDKQVFSSAPSLLPIAIGNKRYVGTYNTLLNFLKIAPHTHNKMASVIAKFFYLNFAENYPAHAKNLPRAISCGPTPIINQNSTFKDYFEYNPVIDLAMKYENIF